MSRARSLAATLALLAFAGCATDEAHGDAVPRGEGVPTVEQTPATQQPATPATRAAMNSHTPTSLYGVDLTGVGFDYGDPKAPITIVEFSDFGCRYCAQFAGETYPTLQKEFVETGRVHWKFVPFVMGTFPNSSEAARSAQCAAEQNALRPMHDWLFANQREWRSSTDPAATFAKVAAEHGLDRARFAACYRENRVKPRMDRNNQAAARLGIRATPTFFINGQLVEGALPLEVFRKGLSQMLGGR